MIIRSKAPLRISFAGGGTDVSPYPEQLGGVVLSTTINKYAYVTLEPREDTELNIHSLDYDISVKYDINGDLRYDGEMDLAKAAFKKFDISTGLDLFLHTDAPPGSGLGSSSAMTVALIGVYKHFTRKSLTSYEISHMAYEIERNDLHISGGMQDQYAATFGGFNFIEFLPDSVVVNRLRIESSILNEVEYNTMLCYTGRTRLSAGIIDKQIGYFVSGREETLQAMEELKKITVDMKNALLLGNLSDFGELLHLSGENKKKMNPLVTNDFIDNLYSEARKYGAIGGKILGAGAGGYLLLYCRFDKKNSVAARLEEIGGQIVSFGLDYHGLQSWQCQ